MCAMATPASGRHERRIRTVARTITITAIIMAGSRDCLAASVFSEGAAGRRHFLLNSIKVVQEKFTTFLFYLRRGFWDHTAPGLKKIAPT